jgi:hypothetical protein
MANPRAANSRDNIAGYFHVRKAFKGYFSKKVDSLAALFQLVEILLTARVLCGRR